MLSAAVSPLYATLKSHVIPVTLHVAQQEVDQAAYLLKCMSLPLSKQVTLVEEEQAMIAAIEAHHCGVFVLWVRDLQKVYKALLNI